MTQASRHSENSSTGSIATGSAAQPATDDGDVDGTFQHSFSRNAFFSKMIVPVASGSVAGGIEICITYPLEFAKSSMQVQPGRFRSMVQAVRYNVGKDGLLVLYRGLPSW